MQKFATRKYHDVLPDLLAAERKAFEPTIYFSDCSPAAGTVAAVKFAGQSTCPAGSFA
jgi:hypothetical protein